MKEQGKDRVIEKNEQKPREEWKTREKGSHGATTEETSAEQNKTTTELKEKWISQRERRIEALWAVCNFLLSCLHSTILLSTCHPIHM